MRQVEELKRKLREVEEEKEEMRRGLEEESETRRGREETRGGEYMLRGSGAGGFASRTTGSAVHVEQQRTEHNDMRQLYFPSRHLNAHLNTRPTKISDGSRQGASMAASYDAFPQLSRSEVHSKAKYQPRQHHQ